MQQEFIENPRRGPRAVARCRAAVTSAGGTFEAETEDIGAAGCRLASPRFVHRGEPIVVRLAHEGVRQGLRVAAHIAWTSELTPWRLGVAFDPDARQTTHGWFERLLADVPGLATFRRVPGRIALGARVYLGPPPRLVVDLTDDERELAVAIGSGITVRDLRARFGQRWPRLQPALFSLLGHRHATFHRGASVSPRAWAGVLGVTPGGFAPPMAAPEAWAPPAADPPPPGPRALPPEALWPPERSPEVDELYARALERLARGQLAAARVLLEQAARAAPGDPGIAAALARAEGRR